MPPPGSRSLMAAAARCALLLLLLRTTQLALALPAAHALQAFSTLTVQPDGCRQAQDAAHIITDASSIIVTTALGTAYPETPGVVRYITSAVKNVPGAQVHVLISDNYTGTGHLQHDRVFYHRVLPQGQFRFHLTHLKVRMYAVACFLQHLPPTAAVFVTDCRDAVFQHDITTRLNTTGTVHLFQEHSLLRIKDNVNLEWVQICAGQPVADAIRGYFILNSGVILGQADMLVRLVQLLVDMLNQHDCDIDQAFLNVVVYTGRAASAGVSFVVHTNEFGPVFNGHDAAATGFRTVGCQIFNMKVRPYAIVHQYDRLPRVAELMEACHKTK